MLRDEFYLDGMNCDPFLLIRSAKCSTRIFTKTKRTAKSNPIATLVTGQGQNLFSHLHYLLYAGVDVLLQFVGLRASRVKMPRDLIEIVSDACELRGDFFQLWHIGHDRHPLA